MKFVKIIGKILPKLDKVTGYKSAALKELLKEELKPARKRFLFIISDAGGGHRASALAVKDEIESIIGDQVQIIIVPMTEMLEPLPRWLGNTLEKTYSGSLKKGAYWMEPVLYSFVKNIRLVPLLLESTCIRVAQYIEHFNPDIIVSFVHNVQDILHGALKYNKKNGIIPLMSVVTDLVSLRDEWMIPEQELVFVPTEEAKIFFMKHGMAEEKIIISGLPINSRFFKLKESRDELMGKYGIKERKFTVMILMGGSGSDVTYKYTKTLNDSGLDVQVIACCGNNKLLKSKMEELSKKASIPIYVFGFTREIPELMKMSDMLVTKPGPGSIAEGISQDLPMLVDDTKYTMWQERGNTDYVVYNCFGWALHSEKDLQVTVRNLFETPSKYQVAKDALIKNPKINATNIIAEKIIESVELLKEN